MKLKSVFTFFVVSFLIVQVVKADVLVNDAYFIAPALGNSTTGFSIAAGTFPNDAIFDGSVDTIAPDLGGGSITVLEVITDNLDGTETIFIEVTSTSGELFPSGFTDGTDPLHLAGLMMGNASGEDPLNFNAPAIVVAGGPFGIGAVIGGYSDSVGPDLSGTGVSTIGPYDISGFSNFTAGPGGGWDGSLGVNMGSGVDLGTSTLGIWITVQQVQVPEPATSSLIGLATLGLVYRRRRR